MGRRVIPISTQVKAVLDAERLGEKEAAKQNGVSDRSIRNWKDDPLIAEICQRTREDLIEEVTAATHLSWQRLVEAMAAKELKPEGLILVAEKATTALQLVTGEATTRAEVTQFRDYDDHERQVLRDAFDRALEGPADEGAGAGVPEGART